MLKVENPEILTIKEDMRQNPASSFLELRASSTEERSEGKGCFSWGTIMSATTGLPGTHNPAS